jgi:predicted O-linked N-acetylglucosamine transferase (SPINDLY family)
MTAPASADDYEARFQQALEQYRAGRLDEAIAMLADLSDEHPDDPSLLLVYATAALRRGDRERGIALLGTVVELQPDNAVAHYQLGVALDEARRTGEALSSYERAIGAKPDFAEAHNNRGVALKALGRPDEALASFERAIRLRPGYAKAHFGRGVTLKDMGRPEEALACFDRAIALRPDHADSHGHRGEVLYLLGRLDQALASYQRAAELAPDRGPWPGCLFEAKRALCDWSGLDTLAATLLAAIEADRAPIDPFTTLLLTDAPELQRRVAERWAKDLAAEHGPPAAIAARRRDERIRIGYFSADFHYHATLHLMLEMLERHDRSRFDLFGFSFGPATNDAWRKRASGCFSRFLDVRSSSDREVAELARSLQLDIAVDLKGYTKDSRAGIFARRCAPIQASYLGYPGTMGAPFIDYLIADHTVIPEAHRQHCTEKIAYLPGCYQPNRRNGTLAVVDSSRADCGLPEGRFVFCCFNNNNKITAQTFDRWMNILVRVDGSVLWLLQSNRWAPDNLRAEARRRGVDPGRLLFSPFLPLEEQLGRIRHADLFLDTLPYNAHTTASDSLRMGVPVLTQIGDAFAARVAASLTRSLGLDELIVRSPEEYEELAVALATEPGRLAAIRRTLREAAATSPLFDPAAIAMNLERLYQRMCERHWAGLAPEHIDA